ncbi:phospholipase [Alteromonas pelagimontana]|uniref:Phospholipase n=1 Tax=Alteromonas pelagimontana TaxID=1858656 RepID=A0A6M4MEM8_9ALTE|nr:VTT domain-containing protein [Alteromonas pelagimontana]QJR81641.1 phospholipase [Alteromonas pelagimontana]
MSANSSIFKQGENCWVTSTASYATPLIDCANYYKALHASIVKAKHSIFIVGWDIDSRIRLLRGDEEEQSEAPSVISDLLAWKAEQNPELKIYLLRWDSSLAFFAQRELWAKEVWDEKTPDNVETVLDDTIPMGGSQHQKIVVIDDEVVFSGGMDVSTNRWDTRDHPVESEERNGPEGEYAPLHDVQMVAAGPVVKDFAELVRWRWLRVAETQPIAIREDAKNALDSPLPEAWPQMFDPWFEKIDCALARTIPFMDEVEPVQEVRHILLDLINEAENVIFIENQFTSRQEIAEALNRRMKACPSLHIIVVSSYEPKGKFECEAFWASRIDFKKILEKDVDPSRIIMTYSSIEDQKGRKAYKRIHSKVMSIDDKYLVIGSSNLSNRSMTLDTEIDTVFFGNTPENSRQIARVRDDLLAEHTGRELDAVSELMKSENPAKALMEGQIAHGYVLTEIHDEVFTDQSGINFFRSLSDPEEPLMPAISAFGNATPLRNPRRRTIMIGIGVIALAIFAGLLILATNSISWLSTENINAFLEKSRGTYFALPTVLLVYLVGGFVFFPVTVMSLAVAAIFGPVWGPIYGIMGALLSSACMFGLGILAGNAGLKKLGGPKIEAVDEKFRNSGIVGVAAIRMLPIAPFSLVNLVAGVSSIGLLPFLVGTFLGMFPPMIAKGLVGDSITQIFRNPSPETIGYLVGGIVLWGLMIWGSQKFAKYYQKRKEKQKAEGEECAVS